MAGGGTGGKLRKKPLRRSSQATPYDRPSIAINNNANPNFLKRILYAGADKLFGVFRKRIPVPRIKETNEEQRNGLRDAGPNSGSKTFTEVSEPTTNEATAGTTTNEARNFANISAGTEISELEKMLKQKTFTRSEIERLTALLHSKTTESDVPEGDKVRISNTSQHLRHEAFTSGPSNKYLDDRENFHAIISTPVVNSRVFEEDVASPAELAKAYMGTRPAKVSPTTLRFDSQAPRQDSVLLHNTTIIPRTPITSFAPKTAGSLKGFENGLTAPRSRGRSALYNMARSPYYRGPSTLSQKASSSLISPQPAWEHEGSIGTTKMAGKRRSSALDDIGSGGPMRRIRQKANIYSQGSSLSKNRSEFGSSRQRLLLRNEPEPKDSKAVEKNGETSKRNISVPSVPSESTKMASKIFEHLERMSPKEKPSRSMLDGTTEKPTTKFTSNQSLGSSYKVESPKFLLTSINNQARESTSLSKNKVEENGPKKFAVPLNVLTSVNGNSTMPIRGNASITNTDSTLKLPAEPPQKKRAFQMSAHEDSQEIDNDNHSNGHASSPLSENLKTGISVFANKVADATSAPKSGFIPPGGSFANKQKVGYNFQTSPPSSSNTQSAGHSQSTSIVDTISLPKEPTVFPIIGNKPSGVKQNTSPDAKPLGSTSLFSSALKNNQVQVSAFSKDDNGNAQKSAFVCGESESSSSALLTTASASGIVSFSDSIKNSSITNGTTSLTNSVSSTFTQAPISSFGYATASSTTALVGPTSLTEAPLTSAIKDKDPKSNNNRSSPFASTSFSSLAPTSTTIGHSQGIPFGFQANTQASAAATQENPFKIGSSPTGIQSSTSGSSLLGSAPSFGLGSTFVSSEIKAGSSASSSTSNMHGSGLGSNPNFGLGSAVSSSPFSFGTSSFTPSTSSLPVVSGSINAGASTGSSLFSFTAACATNSFQASSPPQSVFGNSTPVFNAATASPNKNDPMSMEDSMAEDCTHTPSPAVPASVQASAGTQGFMFGSGTPTTPSTVPLFSGQINQPPVQNPFQLSGSLEFSAAGSFSVGKGEGDKSARRRPFKARRQIKK